MIRRLAEPVKESSREPVSQCSRELVGQYSRASTHLCQEHPHLRLDGHLRGAAARQRKQLRSISSAAALAAVFNASRKIGLGRAFG